MIRSLISASVTRALTSVFAAKLSLQHPPPDIDWKGAVRYERDSVRYGTLALALRRIASEGIPGSLAEIGVYRGLTSRFMRRYAPTRRLFLFDTFEGFPSKDLDRSDTRFQDTAIETVKQAVGDLRDVVIRPGYFPDSAAGLEDEQFALVMLDVDLYNPTKAGLEFFYPRLSPGGYLFVHDYTNVESNHAVSRAADEFLADKPEALIESPDMWGTVVLRKNRK